MHSIQQLLDNSDCNLSDITQAFQSILSDTKLDAALQAEALMLPSEQDVIEACPNAHPQRIHAAREQLRQHLGTALYADLQQHYHHCHQAKGLDDAAMQQRKLKQVCLSYMMASQDADAVRLCFQQFSEAKHMTDQYAALSLLAASNTPERQQALQAFEQQWQHDTHVMDKWFSVQAAAPTSDALATVQHLMQHPLFQLQNPNKVRALIGSFAMRNVAGFHQEDGSGYAFLAEQVLALDAINPQIAARMVRPLINGKQFAQPFRPLMQRSLETILAHKDLSADVFEIVSKSMA